MRVAKSLVDVAIGFICAYYSTCCVGILDGMVSCVLPVAHITKAAIATLPVHLQARHRSLAGGNLHHRRNDLVRNCIYARLNCWMYIASLTSGNPHRAELDKQLRLKTAAIPNVPRERITCVRSIPH